MEDYADALRDGAEFPPIDLFTEDGERYYIGDGIHRADAHVVAGRASILAIVHQGGFHAAHVFACGANKTHGVNRSNADKRHAVAQMLQLEPKWSNRRIAEHVGVSHTVVNTIRGGGKDEPAGTRKGKDGKSYDQQTLQNKGKNSQVETVSTPPLGEADEFDPDEFEAVSVDVAELAAPYKRAVNDLNRIVRDMEEIVEDEKTGAYLADKVVRIRKEAESIKAAIRMMEPVAACPDCVGGCGKCANTGFVTRMMTESKKG